MIEQSIRTSLKTYPVYIGADTIKHLPVFLKNNYPKLTKIFIITDENVAESVFIIGTNPFIRFQRSIYKGSKRRES